MKRCILVMLVVFVLGVSSVYATHLPVIWGAYVEYVDLDTITVTAGSGRCNNNVWEISSEITVELSAVLPAGEDFLYIYIDDSASSYPTPTIVASTTEPAWSDSKIGWYSGNDRCIGSVWCDSSGVVEFQNNSNMEYVINNSSGIKQVLVGGNPNGSYQTVEATAYIPINATGVYIIASNADSNAQVTLYVASYDNVYMNIRSLGYSNASAVGWINIERGGTRDLQWNGQDDDDNSFQIKIMGFRIDR